MTLRALIFDVDGTLAETEEAHRHAFNDSFVAFGLGWHWGRDLYRRLLKTTGGKERMREYAANHAHIDPAEIPVVEIHAYKTARFGELIAGGTVPLRPGITELLADANHRGVRLAVATTTNLPNVDRLIRATTGRAASDLFEVIAAGDMVKAKKPASDVYELALAGLGLAPNACLAFEDSLNGLNAALGAGLPCLVCPGAYTDTDDFARATLKVDSFQEVSSINALAARLRTLQTQGA